MSWRIFGAIFFAIGLLIMLFALPSGPSLSAMLFGGFSFLCGALFMATGAVLAALNKSRYVIAETAQPAMVLTKRAA